MLPLEARFLLKKENSFAPKPQSLEIIYRPARVIAATATCACCLEGSRSPQLRAQGPLGSPWLLLFPQFPQTPIGHTKVLSQPLPSDNGLAETRSLTVENMVIRMIATAVLLCSKGNVFAVDSMKLSQATDLGLNSIRSQNWPPCVPAQLGHWTLQWIPRVLRLTRREQLKK